MSDSIATHSGTKPNLMENARAAFSAAGSRSGLENVRAARTEAGVSGSGHVSLRGADLARLSSLRRSHIRASQRSAARSPGSLMRITVMGAGSGSNHELLRGLQPPSTALP